jgi:iron complex outermembrane receptor protein
LDDSLVANQVAESGTVESEVDAEKINSKEISYFGIFPNVSAQLDIKLFYDKLSGLISEGLSHDVELVGGNRLEQKGIEGQLKVGVSDADNMALSFSYVDVNDDFAGNNSDVTQEGSLSADRSGSLSWIHSFSSNTTLGTAYYHVENWNTNTDDGPYTFSRLDMNVRHTMNLTEEHTLTLQAAMQYRLDDDPLGRNKNNYSDDHFVYGSAQLKF